MYAPDSQYGSIGSDNGLVLISVGMLHWHIYASLGLNELMGYTTWNQILTTHRIRFATGWHVRQAMFVMLPGSYFMSSLLWSGIRCIIRSGKTIQASEACNSWQQICHDIIGNLCWKTTHDESYFNCESVKKLMLIMETRTSSDLWLTIQMW